MNGRPEIREHIARPPLPWRPESDLTECGKPAGEFKSVLSRVEAKAKIKAQGRARAAFTTCMTCWDTVDRWPTWDEDPVKAMAREFQHVGYLHAHQRDARLHQELVAIAELVRRNADELRELIEAVGTTTDLTQVRRARSSRVLPWTRQ